MAATVLGEEENAGAADCVVLEAAFASYRDITDDVMKKSWLLWPLRWMVVPGMPAREQDPENRIAGIAPTPLLILHSDEDEVVPYSHGERLYAAAQAPGSESSPLLALLRRMPGPGRVALRGSSSSSCC